MTHIQSQLPKPVFLLFQHSSISLKASIHVPTVLLESLTGEMRVRKKYSCSSVAKHPVIQNGQTKYRSSLGSFRILNSAIVLETLSTTSGSSGFAPETVT